MRRQKLTLGVIVGTRGCFSAELAQVGRRQLLDQIRKLGHRGKVLQEATTTYLGWDMSVHE